MKRRWLFVLPFVVLMVSCDQTSKRLALELLEGLGPHSYIGGAVVLLYTENSGAFLGLGAALAEPTRFWLFTVGVAVLLLLFVFKLHRASNTVELIGWSLVIGGGLGNLVDRILRDGRVIDFVRLGVGGLRTGIFNFADAAIVGGLILLLVAALLPERARARMQA